MLMSRRRFMKLTSEFSAGALAAAFILPKNLPAEEKTTEDKKPNILFMLSDDHSWPYLGCYGNPDLKTPNIDSIAAEGMRFSRAYVTSPQCAPSRNSIMTGRSPVDIRATRFTAPLSADYVAFPELLRTAGYYTGVGGRCFHNDGPPDNQASEVDKKVFKKYNLRTFSRRVDYIDHTLEAPARAERTYTQILTDFLDKVPQGRPFFMEFNFHDPHRPWTAKEFEPDPNSLTIPKVMPDLPSVRQDLAAHYGELQRLDGDVGKILELLRKRNLIDNTIVIFMGDNGAALLRGKGTLYECGLRVPLVIRWPKCIKPNSTCDALISGEDFAPTFLEIAGITAPNTMTGVSFLDALKGKPFTGREFAFAERGAHGAVLPRNTVAFDLSRCVISKKYKLIYNALWQLPYEPVDFSGAAVWKDLQKRNAEGKLEPKYSRTLFAKSRPMFELYDLEKDPYEFDNLAGNPQMADIEKQLKETLYEKMILWQDYLPLPIEVPSKVGS